MTCAFRLLAITPPHGPVDPQIVDVWLAAGALGSIAVLLREPGAPPRRLLAGDGRLAPLRRRCVAAGVPVLLALDAAALDALEPPPELAGLHLRGDPDLTALRRARERTALLGRACHGEPQPGHELVDYTVFAPVFAPGTVDPTMIKRPAGLAALTRWTADPRAHVIALGGICPATAPACLAAGARGLAGISGLFGEPARVEQDVAALVRLVDPR
ncbi:MAG: thiamine phosphate synthase [Myxococcales bacterium]|nr:thiamine phosphate synthase [Myxococcales bacterium]